MQSDRLRHAHDHIVLGHNEGKGELMRIRFAAAVFVWGAIVASAAPGARSQARTVPAGVQFNVLLQTAINSGAAKAEQRFEAASIETIKAQGQVVIEIGAVARGFVSSVKPSGKDGQPGQLTLSFDELRLGDRTVRLRASVVNVLDPKRPEEMRQASTASVVGGEGSFGLAPLLDVMVNGSGSIVSTGGIDVKLPIGVVLRLRLDQPLEIPAVFR
jgi:hypothetical protein